MKLPGKIKLDKEKLNDIIMFLVLVGAILLLAIVI